MVPGGLAGMLTFHSAMASMATKSRCRNMGLFILFDWNGNRLIQTFSHWKYIASLVTDLAMDRNIPLPHRLVGADIKVIVYAFTGGDRCDSRYCPTLYRSHRYSRYV